MQQKRRAQLLGGVVGLLVGAVLGLLPGLDDALRPTHYAQSFGRAAVIEMFLPVALIGGVVGAIAGAVAVSWHWHCRSRRRAQAASRPDERSWPPAPKGS